MMALKLGININPHKKAGSLQEPAFKIRTLIKRSSHLNFILTA